jgi:hypothetical protein
MAKDPLRPMCFVAMPFGKRTPPGKKKPLIDFDEIYGCIKRGAEAAGLESIRADFEPSGGFIHKPMLERLLVAEYVIADLTLSNPNVLYEIGVRHGASSRATLLVGAEKFLKDLVFDLRPLRVLPYTLAKDGSIGNAEGRKLARGLRERLELARHGELPMDNPIMQVTSWKPLGTIEHSKTDVFLQRLQYTGELGQRIKAAVALSDETDAVNQLAKIEQEVVHLPNDVAQVHTALMGVFLGYRERKAYKNMEALFEKFPKELKQTPVAREQYALASNRLAEQSSDKGAGSIAEDLRSRGLTALDTIESEGVTSETHGIRGRIYKGWHDALAAPGDQQDSGRADAMLEKAIETYEEGFRKNIRDYYPGVNAVTLRLLRGTKSDIESLRTLIPVVRYSVGVAPVPKNDEEMYWQTATKLELATANRDWKAATQYQSDLLGLNAKKWMLETTAANLGRQRKALGRDGTAKKELGKILGNITPR